MDTLLLPYSDAIIFIARLVAGTIFLYYGIPKIKDLKENAREFEEDMGFKPGWFWGTPIAFLEVLGGLGLIFGIYVWFWAILFAAMMVVGTVWKIKNPKKGFGSWSYDLTLLAIMLLLLMTGPGAYALL